MKRVLVILEVLLVGKVSLSSGKACIKALKKLGYKTSSFDPKPLNLINKEKIDIIFNALHGRR